MKITQGPRAAHSTPGHNLPLTRIVVHSAVAPCAPGVARKIAAYFATDAAGGSAHYTVDPDEIVQSLDDNVVAWHAPPNGHSLGVEMCDQPTTNLDRWYPEDPKRGEKAARGLLRFLAPAPRRMLRRTADLVAEKCLEHDVTPRWVGVAALKRGEHGITSHANVSKAFKQSTHWDPGSWPRRAFMRRVRKTYTRLTKESAR